MHLHTVCLANAMQNYANKNKNKNKKEKLNINKKAIRLSVSIGRTGGVVFLFQKKFFIFRCYRVENRNEFLATNHK